MLKFFNMSIFVVLGCEAGKFGSGVLCAIFSAMAVFNLISLVRGEEC